jgi:hypothetical protein
VWVSVASVYSPSIDDYFLLLIITKEENGGRKIPVSHSFLPLYRLSLSAIMKLLREKLYP